MVIAASALGCDGGPPQALRFGISAAPATLDPRLATDASSTRINRLLYARLIDFDATSRPVPSLATWKRLSPTRYRVMLGERGRRFHDGTRLSANDVRETYRSVLDARTASPHRSALAVIRRIDVLDDDTLEFHLERRDPLFPGRLGLGILPAHLVRANHPFARHPVGSGPCAFLDWPDDNRLRLRRLNDGQVIEFVRVPDPTVRVLKLLRGEIDLLQSDLPPELIGYLKDRTEVQVSTRPGTNFTYLGFNLADPLTGQLRVRRAIAHGIDRAAIIHYVLRDAARPAAALLPPEHWAGDAALPSYAYDPAKARTLLGEREGSGVAHLVFKTSNDPLRVRLATAIQHQLRQIGLQVEVRSYDWGTFYGDVKSGNFQMFSLSWVAIHSPDIFRYIFHSRSLPPEGANRGRFASDLADRLIEAAERTDDIEQQAALYRQLQRYLWETLPYVPLWYEHNVAVTRKEVQGYRVAADGRYDGLLHTYRVPRPMPSANGIRLTATPSPGSVNDP